MGANSSHHGPEWFDRNRPGTSFRRAASLRHTKSKANNSSPTKIDKFRRSFRESFRRRKDTTLSEAEKTKLWQNDEINVRSGTCSFRVKYYGCVEVFESRGMPVCEEALKVLKNCRRRPIKAILYVSGDGLRVVEDDTKGLIVDQTIEKVSFCAPDKNHDRGFSYICRDGTSQRWMCHGFLALKESGERLSHAVGCAFAVCLERKQKRDKECSVTMNFDMQNSTFTRMGSFRHQTLTEKLKDTTNIKNNAKASLATSSNNTIFETDNPAKTAEKENIPLTTTPKLITNAIERPHATVSMMQRQGSIRGLSNLNNQAASPFKRTRSLDRYSIAARTPTSHGIHSKTPVSPIPEISPIHSSDLNLSTANTVTDQVSAMCQQLSQGLSLLMENNDLSNSKTTELSWTRLSARDLFADEENDFSQLIELKTMTTSSSTFKQKPSSDDSNILLDQLFSQPSQPLQQLFSSDVLELLDTTAPTNNTYPDVLELTSTNTPNNNTYIISNNTNNNVSTDDINNSSTQSNPMSSPSSLEIPLTPPATPPLTNNAQLPNPEQWLGKVAQLTMNVSNSSSSPSSPPSSKRLPTPGMHTRAYSLSSVETVLCRASTDNHDKPDPFDIDWVSLTIDTKPTRAAHVRSTNPFLTGSPMVGSSSAADDLKKSFEAQM